MNNLSPIDWALRPLKNYAKFSGRASRAEFWWFFLFVLIVYFVAMIALGAAGGAAAMNPGAAILGGGFGVLSIFVIVFWLALFIPTLAVQIRRLHDINRSGWWLGAFWLLYLVYMAVTFRSLFRGTLDGTPPTMSGLAGAMVIALAMFVYSIVLLVFFCMRGTKGDNRFGPDPYGEDMEEVFA